MGMSKLKIGRKNLIDHLKSLNGNQPLRILTLQASTSQMVKHTQTNLWLLPRDWAIFEDW